MDYTGDQDRVRRAILTNSFGSTEARIVAAWWQGPDGDGYPFTAFQSTGTITADLPDKIIWLLNSAIQSRHNVILSGLDRTALRALLRHVNEQGERGPVDGWDQANHY